MNFSILYVDDEFLNLVSMKILLERNYPLIKLYTAYSVQEALACLEGNTIQIVLTDYKMPGENGLDLLNIVKEKYPHCGRFILTGFSDLEDIQEAIVHGLIHKVYEKPVVYESMLQEFLDFLK